MTDAFSSIAQGLGASIPSMFQGLMSNVASRNMQLITANIQKDLMKTQAKINYKYAMKDLLNKWNYNRQGLEAAGYNPMLALGGVNSNSSWASPQSVTDGSGIGANMLQGFANTTAQQNADIQQQLADYEGQMLPYKQELAGSTSELNNATAGLNRQAALLTQLKQDEQIIRNSNLPKQLKADLIRTNSETVANYARANADTMNAGSNRTIANATSRSVDANVKLIRQQIENLKKQGKISDVQYDRAMVSLKYANAQEISEVVGKVLAPVGVLAGTIIGGKVGMQNSSTNKMRYELEKQKYQDSIMFEKQRNPVGFDVGY